MKIIFIITCFSILAIRESNPKLFNPLLVFKLVKPQILGTIENSLEGTQCASDLKKFVVDLFKLKWWAIRMFDASSKLHPGFFNGNYQLFGNYDQCLTDLTETTTSLSKKVINSQYCTVSLNTTGNITKSIFNMVKNIGKIKGYNRTLDWKFFIKYTKIFFGLCLPKSCTIKNLNNLWTQLQKIFQIPLEAKFLEGSCVSDKQPTQSVNSDFYVLLFFGTILAIVISSTFYDILAQKHGKLPNILACFSLYTNTKHLLSTHCENDSLTCLYGIRVFSIAWVIIGHIASIEAFSANTNMLYVITEWKNSYPAAFLMAAPYAVDTFFSISGLLVIYVHLKYSEKIKIKLFAFYLHRIIRLVPALFATVLIYKNLYIYVSDGPVWSLNVRKIQAPCEQAWWATLLFFNNFLDYYSQCMQHSWYLSVDTQLYVIVAPVIIYFIKKEPSKTFLGIAIVSLFSIIYSSVMTVYYNLGFVPFWEMDENEAIFIYYNPISRIPSWLIGVVTGYLLYKNKYKKISKRLNLFLWIVSLSLMLSLILYQLVLINFQFNVFRSAFFNSCSRLLWSLSVCFIIFSCSTGNGDIINKFLSHPIFIVLGKLNYSMYLTHVLVIMAVSGNQRQAGYFSNFRLFCDFCSNSVIIIICSTLMCLIFETPFISLLKHLDKPKDVKTQ